jgi:dolichol-phosphate mannosyltransferase
MTDARSSAAAPARLSIVAPCYNESAVFPALRRELTAFAAALPSRYRLEIVLVDDGSSDDTWAQIAAFSRDDARVRGISLSRNFGHQAALTCAYDLCSGDVIVSIDADLQDPLAVIHAMLQRWEEGADVVFAVRERRLGETVFKRVTALAFYRMMRSLGAQGMRLDSGDFRLLSRRALDGLRALPEYHRFIRGLVGWIGFKTAEVYYQREARRAGVSHYSLRKMLRLAFDALVSFSLAPLRIAFGLSAAFVAAAVMVAASTLLTADGAPGWAWVVAALFGAMQMLILGFLGEYVGRIYEEAKRRPLYLVNVATPASAAAEHPLHASAS